MNNKNLFLGIDLGTSGIKIALLNNNKELVYKASKEYSNCLESCIDWEECTKSIINEIPSKYKRNIAACSIDGTSGTLTACSKEGKPFGKAIAYYNNCLEESDSFIDIFKNQDISINSYGSITRAISLLKQYGENILLRHQADWVSGLLLGHWKYGEGSNNIRLGWDIINKNWIPEIKSIKWRKSLPIIISSGKNLGRISHLIARDLNLPLDIQIISGTTDSNAAVLATDSSPNEGVTVLGSTLVMKCYTKEPINSPGITNHRVGGKWVCGGASNSGGAVLKQFFTEKDLIQLSRQINPLLRSGLKYFPIATKGERFPIDDPTIEPILTPRPTSDALYLHGLLEGIANIEAQGWSKLAELGAHIPKKIITIGGGARNPQWRQIREQVIGIPIQTCTKEPAEGVARLAIQGFSKV